jgi:ankyrin repeat protein
MSLERKPIDEKKAGEINIKQRILIKKMEQFLAHVSSEEKVIQENGLCNGLVAMLMRARILGQKEKFFHRLKRLSTMTDNELATLGQIIRMHKEKYTDYFKKIKFLENKRTENQLALLAENKKQLAANISPLNKEKINELEKKINEANIKITSMREKRENDILELQKKMGVEKIEKAQDLYDFIHSLLIAHDLKEINLIKDGNNPSIADQYDFERTFQLLSDDKDEKKLAPKMVNQIILNFSENELIKAIDELVLEGDDVLFGSSNHSTHLTKSNGKYIWYDPNHPQGEQVFASSQELVNTLKENFGKSLKKTGSFLSELTIFSNSNAPRKDALVTLEEILAKREENTINEQDTATKSSPLLLAVTAQNLSIAKKFLSLGADPNIINIKNNFPLRRACLKKNNALITLLLSYGSDPNLLYKKKSLLYAMILSKDMIRSEILLKHGADPNFCDENGNSCLHLAVKQKNSELVALLLKYGANPELKNAKGISVYQLAKNMDPNNSIFNALHNYMKIKSINPALNEHISKMKAIRLEENEKITELKVQQHLNRFSSCLEKFQNTNASHYASTVVYQSCIQNKAELKANHLSSIKQFDNEILKIKFNVIIDALNNKIIQLNSELDELKSKAQALKDEYAAKITSANDAEKEQFKTEFNHQKSVLTSQYNTLQDSISGYEGKLMQMKESYPSDLIMQGYNKLLIASEELQKIQNEKESAENAFEQTYATLKKQEKSYKKDIESITEKQTEINEEAKRIFVETQKLLDHLDAKADPMQKTLCDSLLTELNKETPDYNLLKKNLSSLNAIQSSRKEIPAWLLSSQAKKAELLKKYDSLAQPPLKAHSFLKSKAANDAVISAPDHKLKQSRPRT